MFGYLYYNFMLESIVKHLTLTEAYKYCLNYARSLLRTVKVYLGAENTLKDTTISFICFNIPEIEMV